MSDVRRLAHQVMLGSFSGPVIPDWLAQSYADGLAGICLYGANLDAEGDVTELAQAVRALDPTAVLTLDEEGGDVTRLHMRHGSPYPGNAALGIRDDVQATQVVAAAIGAELAAAGIWLNLAPSADINSDPRNPVIGTRSFGQDPALVARHTSAYVAGLASQGVAACIKHFPGHGDTVTDSHIGLPHVSAPADVVRSRELVPFVANLDAASIMTSHVVLEAFDADQPATLSRAVLTDLLRKELGYAGVIVSDALDMAGASAIHGIGGAAVLSLAAGADLLCLGPEPTDQPSLITEAVDAVCRAVEEGHLDIGRLSDAAERVEALRTAWASFAPRADAAEVIADGRALSVEVAAAITATAPRFTGPATVLRINTGTNPAVGPTSWGQLDLGGTTIDLVPAALEGTPSFTGEVAIVVRRVDAVPEVSDWVQRQLADNPRAVLIELGWPSPALDDHDQVVRTYGSAAVLTDALGAALRAER
ncbi:glycoside hydrolase family 3 N-terminal domain-containing protein [Aeromicrobium sp.]|uniref:glycoside hydrolase family 3 N-terminal domain-containing protein n=1 Tax=Aeromicrobium sp. TaxID=1871063 RepID=UPI002FCAF296